MAKQTRCKFTLEFKARVALGLLFTIFSLNSFSQNSYQKILYSDSVGFFGMTLQADSSALLGCQVNGGFKLLDIDQFGNITTSVICTDSNIIYIQGMLALKDGGTLLYGNVGASGLAVKLDNQHHIQWARHLPYSFGFDHPNYFADAVEDDSGILYLMLQMGSFPKIIALNPSGELIWSKTADVYFLTGISACDDGGCYVTAMMSLNMSFIWKLSPSGLVEKSASLIMIQPMSLLMDLLELPDGQIILIFQNTIDNLQGFVLASLDTAWNINWTYRYQYFLGFRSSNTLLLKDTEHFLVMGAVNNPNPDSLFYAPFHMFLAEFQVDGTLINSSKFTGDRLISGGSQGVVTKDGGVMICGYACDSISYPYFPFLVKTNSSNITDCFRDTIPLIKENYSFTINQLIDPLINSDDSLIAIALTMNNVNQQPFQTLCYTGINDITDSEDIIISPNPVNNFLTITIPGKFRTVAALEIYSITGQLISTINIPSGKDNITIDVTGFMPGSYFIRLNSASSGSTARFIKL